MDHLFTAKTLKEYALIWKEMKEGGVFNDNDQLVADALKMHPEFDEFWPQGEIAMYPQEVNNTVVNPLIHMGLHVIIEKQFQEREPEEAHETFQLLLSKGVDRHEALHHIIGIWAELYYRSVREAGSLYDWEYVELLKGLARAQNV